MSYNPGIAYVGPDAATLSMTRELTARFGAPPRPYEFVTGWKDPLNVSGHNPDSNGITHGVDIFTGNLRWTADHLAARGRAGDKRVRYVIYAGQLANDRTGWQFAGEGWGHWDHVHLSVWDGYWGGPCSLPESIYNDTSSWGIATIITGQGSGITPIPSEEDDMPTLDEIFNHPIARSDGKGDITLASMLRYYSADIDGVKQNIAAVAAEVKPIEVSGGKKVPLRQFVADGTRAAQAAASHTADINTASGPVSLRQFVADGTRAAQKLEPIVVDIAKAITAPDVDKSEADK